MRVLGGETARLSLLGSRYQSLYSFAIVTGRSAVVRLKCAPGRSAAREPLAPGTQAPAEHRLDVDQPLQLVRSRGMGSEHLVDPGTSAPAQCHPFEVGDDICRVQRSRREPPEVLLPCQQSPRSAKCDDRGMELLVINPLSASVGVSLARQALGQGPLEHLPLAPGDRREHDVPMVELKLPEIECRS